MSDPIQFECPSCAAVLRVPFEMAGFQAPCPICHHQIAAPNPHTGMRAYLPPPPPPHPPSALAGQPAPQPAPHVPEPPAPQETRAPFSDSAAPPITPQARSPFSDTPSSSLRMIQPKGLPERQQPNPVQFRKIEAPSVADEDQDWDTGAATEPHLARRTSRVFLACLITALLCLTGGVFIGNHLRESRSVPPVVTYSPPVKKPETPVQAKAAIPVVPEKKISPADDIKLPAPPPVEAKLPEKPAEIPPAPKPAAEPPADAKSKGVEEAETVLRSFLRAPDWAARSAYVLSSDVMRPKMEAYSLANPDGPTAFDSFTVKHAQEDDEAGSELIVFQVNSGKIPGGVPAAVFKTKDGWLVDWESFVEFRDDQFKHFTEGPVDLVGEFHLIVSVPAEAKENENFATFQISPPLANRHRNAFVAKSSPAYEQLREATRENGIFTPVLKITKRSAPGDQSYLEILSISADNWRPREDLAKP